MQYFSRDSSRFIRTGVVTRGIGPKNADPRSRTRVLDTSPPAKSPQVVPQSVHPPLRARALPPGRTHARATKPARPTCAVPRVRPPLTRRCPSSVSSTDIGKDSEHKVSACDHGCASQHAPHSTLPDWVAPPQATRCPAAAQLVCHRRREHALSPRPVHLPRPAYRPRTPA